MILLLVLLAPVVVSTAASAAFLAPHSLGNRCHRICSQATFGMRQPLRYKDGNGGDDVAGDGNDSAAPDAAPEAAGADPSEISVPSFITSPVLRAVYPSMLAHKSKYGNPNIPLGNVDGKRCKTLRRLAFQNKLSEEEVALLEDMGFRFRSFEDVYEEADFDDCLQRLIEYEKEFQTGYQIPKKYAPDPELGAWVTLIRRIGRETMEETEPDRRAKLDEIGFAWISTRKCGSSFMKFYRPLLERLETAAKGSAEEKGEGEGDGETVEGILSEEEVRRWIRAQREAHEKGNLAESRVGYMDKLTELTGVEWR